jgi:DNA-binding LacI/PurR family transcriptional regulator
VTAIACLNDLVAIGAYRGVRDEGLQVGKDVAIVGFDDIFLTEIVQPTLTTIHQPLDQMAKLAVSHLLAMVDSSNPSTLSSVRLPAQLIVRQSTAA